MKWLTRMWGTWLAAALAVLVAGAAHATTVFAVPLEQMTHEADIIVHARVGAQRVTWDENRARVLTLTTIEVIEAVKGARKGELLTIYQVAGTLDGITYKIPGALKFEVGEELVFFAQRFEERNMIVSYGMGLGKYQVVKRDGATLVTPEYGNVAFVKRTADGKLEHAYPPDLNTQPLPRFIERLHTILASGQGGGR